MNPTAEAATTAHTGNGSKSGSSMANEGKQNEGEKQEVLCVSIKICHSTHFSGLAYKDTNTKTNPTAKATTTACKGNGSKSSSSTSNEGKQNEGEKQVVLCVSIKICHLTHFTGLAYKDTNEVIVRDFLGWYADQTFGRSSATTPPVDMVFDT
jgi:hypothetical protein